MHSLRNITDLIMATLMQVKKKELNSAFYQTLMQHQGII